MLKSDKKHYVRLQEALQLFKLETAFWPQCGLDGQAQKNTGRRKIDQEAIVATQEINSGGMTWTDRRGVSRFKLF